MKCTLRLLSAAFLILATFFFQENCRGVPVTTPEAPRVISSNERIVMGSIVAPDRSELEPFDVLFRGEKKQSDGSGIYSFVKKADVEAFEATPFKKKMMQCLQGKSEATAGTNSPDQEAIPVSPLISSSGKVDKFYILITKDIEPVLEGTNDISGFRQVSGAPHLFFSCIAQNSETPDVEILIKPTSIQKRNFLFAPDKTIVILMNPNRVKKIEYWPFKLDSQFIQLPRIVLQTEEEISGRKHSKESSEIEDASLADQGGRGGAQNTGVSLKKANLVRQSVKSNMYGLDLAPFFEAPDTVVVSKRIARNQLVEIRL